MGSEMCIRDSSFFSGLILQTIARKNRQDFEMQLIRTRDQYESVRG